MTRNRHILLLSQKLQPHKITKNFTSTYYFSHCSFNRFCSDFIDRVSAVGLIDKYNWRPKYFVLYPYCLASKSFFELIQRFKQDIQKWKASPQKHSMILIFEANFKAYGCSLWALFHCCFLPQGVLSGSLWPLCRYATFNHFAQSFCGSLSSPFPSLKRLLMFAWMLMIFIDV